MAKPMNPYRRAMDDIARGQRQPAPMDRSLPALPSQQPFEVPEEATAYAQRADDIEKPDPFMSGLSALTMLGQAVASGGRVGPQNILAQRAAQRAEEGSQAARLRARAEQVRKSRLEEYLQEGEQGQQRFANELALYRTGSESERAAAQEQRAGAKETREAAQFSSEQERERFLNSPLTDAQRGALSRIPKEQLDALRQRDLEPWMRDERNFQQQLQLQSQSGGQQMAMLRERMAMDASAAGASEQQAQATKEWVTRQVLAREGNSDPTPEQVQERMAQVAPTADQAYKIAKDLLTTQHRASGRAIANAADAAQSMVNWEHAATVAGERILRAPPELVRWGLVSGNLSEIPRGFTPQDAQLMASDIGVMTGESIHAQYGANQTKQEMKRAAAQTGTGMLSDPSVLKRWVKEAQDRVSAERGLIRAQLDPVQLQQFDQRLGQSAGSAGPKRVLRRQYSPSQNKTYVTYEGGEVKVLDGRQ